jgi:hypothetical protein
MSVLTHAAVPHVERGEAVWSCVSGPQSARSCVARSPRGRCCLNGRLRQGSQQAQLSSSRPRRPVDVCGPRPAGALRGGHAGQEQPAVHRSDKRRVGRGPISCVIVDLQRPARCNSEVVFRRGTIALQGELRQPRFVFAVTGGTGAFQNARGEAHGRVLGHDPVRLTFHLRGVRGRR